MSRHRPQEKGEGKGEGEGGTLQSTGHLGDVMKESTEIAYTYAKVKQIFRHLGTHELYVFIQSYILELLGDERKLEVEKCLCPPSRT